MANKKNNQVDAAEQELKNFEGALSTSEAFLEKNQKPLLYSLAAIVAVLVCWLVVDNFMIQPKSAEAAEQMALGQLYYAAGQYEKAINGDSIEFIGFAAAADEYSITKSGNLAKAYAGLAYFKLADYDNAISFLKDFSASDNILQYTVKATLGDCYAMKGDTEEAISCYKKAAKSENILVVSSSLMKLGRAYESLGDYAKALDAYKELKSRCEGKITGITDIDEIDKFIENAALKNGK
jgi:tetratricopeptide (TPR) repeat protein